MKNLFIKILALSLTLIMLVAVFSSCGDKSAGVKKSSQANFVGIETFTFMPAEPSNRGVEEFKEAFRNIDLYDDQGKYGECFNFIPKDISDEYGINAFSYVVNGRTYYYILCDGEIFRVDTIGGNADADHGFVQFALADYNSDGFFELLCSYNASREPDENGKRDYCHSHVFILDSRTNKNVRSYTNYDGIIYFKKDDDGLLDAWQSKDKNPENANTFYCDLRKNTTEYKFAKETVNLKSDNYSAVVTVTEGTVHFPIIFDNLSLTFDVTVKMTYLGKTFTYTNSTGYLAGAEPRFVSGEDEVAMEGWFETTVVKKFTVKRGQILERDYRFYDSTSQPCKEGTYDLIVEYRGEEVTLEDFLTVKRK